MLARRNGQAEVDAMIHRRRTNVPTDFVFMIGRHTGWNQWFRRIEMIDADTVFWQETDPNSLKTRMTRRYKVHYDDPWTELRDELAGYSASDWPTTVAKSDKPSIYSWSLYARWPGLEVDAMMFDDVPRGYSGNPVDWFADSAARLLLYERDQVSDAPGGLRSMIFGKPAAVPTRFEFRDATHG